MFFNGFFSVSHAYYPFSMLPFSRLADYLAWKLLLGLFFPFLSEKLHHDKQQDSVMTWLQHTSQCRKVFQTFVVFLIPQLSALIPILCLLNTHIFRTSSRFWCYFCWTRFQFPDLRTTLKLPWESHIRYWALFITKWGYMIGLHYQIVNIKLIYDIAPFSSGSFTSPN